jgi:hypothetical protein
MAPGWRGTLQAALVVLLLVIGPPLAGTVSDLLCVVA